MAANFDPYTGKPLNPNGAANFDPYTGQPIQQPQMQQPQMQQMSQAAAMQQQMQQQAYAQNMSQQMPKKKSKKGLIIAASIVGAAGLGTGAFFLGMSGAGGQQQDDAALLASIQDAEAAANTNNNSNNTQFSTDTGNLLGTEEVTNTEDKWTIMLYMVGSNLESENSLYTRDFKEFEKLNLTDEVNMIVQTGGAKEWHYDGVEADKVQRFEVSPGGASVLEEVYAKDACPVATKEELSEFIQFCAENYPAERYGIIMCDHGGGTAAGFGLDELFPEEGLDIVEMQEAFRDACGATGVHFDFVGFDACLMGTMEYAYAFKDYADYYLASEETEFSLIGDMEGYGSWSYTQWVDALCENPDMLMDDPEQRSGLGRLICDNYFDSYDFYNDPNQVDIMHDPSVGGFDARTTLSLIDLSKVDALYDAMCEMYSEMSKYLISGDEAWYKIVKARNDCYEFGQGEYDQIDLLQFMHLTELPAGNMYDWEKAVNDCIVYKRNDAQHANGLAIYFPMHQLEVYADVRDQLEKIGYTGAYFGFFDSFVARYEGYASGQGTSGDTLGNGTEYATNENAILESPFAMDDAKDGYGGRQLTQEQMMQTDTISLQMLVEAGNQLLYLGRLDTAQYDQDGFIYALTDGYWVTINEYYVYLEYMGDRTDDTNTVYNIYYAPAKYNGVDISVIVAFNTSVGTWECWGCDYEGELYSFAEGDEIEFAYIFYDYGLDASGNIVLDEASERVEENAFSVVAGKDGYLSVAYEEITGVSALVFRDVLLDIYGNAYFSEWIPAVL